MIPNPDAPRMKTADAIKILEQLNPDNILIQNKEKSEEAIMASMASERAMREPIPSIVNYAFDEELIEVMTSIGIVKVRKMKAIDTKIFKLMDSPIYQLIMGDIKEENIQSLCPNEDIIFALIYQFTHDAREVYNEVKKNKEAFYEKVIEYVGFTYEVNDLALLVNAILQHMGITNNAKINAFASQSEDSTDIIGDKKKLISPISTNIIN